MKYTKWNYQMVKEYLKNKGYELISKEYINANTSLIFKDIDGYYYFQTLSNFLNKSHVKFSSFNPYTIQNIKLWCKLNNKPFELVSNTFVKAIQKLKWKCFECGEIFECEWSVIQSGCGCGVCRGFQVSTSNCLATLFPELVSEWHPTKNGSLTPHDVTCGSQKRVWWKCEKGHEWKTAISNRTNKKISSNCPYCWGRYASKDNNLLISNPELCQEWNYIHNDKFPNEYTPKSNKKVWWKCKDCGYEWKDAIYHRTDEGRSCPQCNLSKGEKECKRIFITNDLVEINQNDYSKLSEKDKIYNIYFIPQKEFDGLVG